MGSCVTVPSASCVMLPFLRAQPLSRQRFERDQTPGRAPHCRQLGERLCSDSAPPGGAPLAPALVRVLILVLASSALWPSAAARCAELEIEGLSCFQLIGHPSEQLTDRQSTARDGGVE